MIGNLAKKIFGTKNDRELKRMSKFVKQINELEESMQALNDEFASLVAEGVIHSCSALEGEEEHLDLPRLRFIYTRRDYGTLRNLINRINEYDAANHPEVPLLTTAS